MTGPEPYSADAEKAPEELEGSGQFLLPVLFPEGSGVSLEMLSSLGKCVSGIAAYGCHLGG